MGTRDYPPIGAAPELVRDLVVRRWIEQDAYLRPHVRQVEENVRMVAGRHWDVWVDILGKFVDVGKYLTEEERRWRQRPVFNWVGYWYAVTHAKFTENPPVLTFLPATADRKDALLAEVLDPIYKYLWDVVDMDIKGDMLARWTVAAGSAVLKSFWDADAGEVEPLIAPVDLPVLDGFGQVIDLTTVEVPWNIGPSGHLEPMVDMETGQITGDPLIQRAGQVATEVLSPLELRSSPEPCPFRDKRWRVQRSVLHVDEIRERYGVEVDPARDLSGENSTLNRLLFGLGSVGAAGRKFNTDGDWQKQMDGFAEVYELWEKPRDGAPEGRHAIVLPTGVGPGALPIDEPNPIDPEFDPYIQDDFIALPDRPFGKSPVEDLASIQRSYNRGWGQILEHRNLMTNPMWVVDSASGVSEISGAPGSIVRARFFQNKQPLYPVQPPSLSGDVWRIQGMLKEEMQDIGSLRSGSEGRPPTMDASGELVKELRYNDDRFVGPALRRIAHNRARMVETWQLLIRFGWTEERMIRVGGEEGAARFITVSPELFSGRVNVRAVAESMFPEGRGEKQKRLDFWVAQGLITPDQYFDLYNHPHLGRAVRAGGVHRSMAEREHAQMLQGVAVLPIEPHDDQIHLQIHNEFMASPDFMDLGPDVQQLFVVHVEAHRGSAAMKALKEAEMAAMVAGQTGQMETMAQMAAAAPAVAAQGGAGDRPQLTAV